MKTPPERWTTRATPAREDDEARAGRVLRHAVVKQPLTASTLAEIGSRLPEEDHRGPLQRRALSVSVAIALFLSGGAVVMSATLLTRWSPFRRAPVKAPITLPMAEVPRVHHAVAAARVEAVADPAPLAPGPALEPLRRARTSQPIESTPTEAIDPPMPDAPPPVVEAPARPSAIAEEAALLGEALHKLREQDDAAGALALLDEHDRRFSTSGALTDEASTTRVEALLRLGQHARALSLLDARSPRAVGRGRELLASRGELRADAARCREAIADFDALLTDDTATDGAAERALYGRAACHARMGDDSSARVDLEAYVARFPSGRFAQRARATLAP